MERRVFLAREVIEAYERYRTREMAIYYADWELHLSLFATRYRRAMQWQDAVAVADTLRRPYVLIDTRTEMH